MQKIISLFQRNYDGDRLVRDEVVPGAEWVLAGEGQATRKFDGTCCMIRDGKLFKRYDAKKGKTPPAGFEPAQEPDPATGHHPGWIPVGDGPDDRWHRQAWENQGPHMPKEGPVGTCELCGPKINGNPEREYVEDRVGADMHLLIPHGRHLYAYDDGNEQYSMLKVLTFDSIREFLSRMDIEGIVWHHPDGRMVKIKGKDFGFKRPSLAPQTDDVGSTPTQGLEISGQDRLRPA